MPSKYSSKGTILQVEVASVFTPCGSIITLDGPDPQVQHFDGTDIGSDHVEDGELIGRSTPGTQSGELFYDPVDPVHAQMAGDVESGGAYRNWKNIYPDSGASEVTYNGSMQTFKPKAAVSDGFKADFSIKLRTMASMPSAA